MEHNYAFIIPAFNPDEKLIKVVCDLRKQSKYPIFIVDDGSNNESKKVFATLRTLSQVHILTHVVNMGKGAALKTAFNIVLTKYPEISGVVTCDSDGQHSTHDCMMVLGELEKNQSALVLGCRTFQKDIPLKSYLGNNISNIIYRLVLGRSFSDTQTGLRGLTRDVMLKSLHIHANRFEFETEQLALVSDRENNIKIIEIAIQTIYIDGNKKTSFRPIIDSFKIYFVLLRYTFVSLLTFITDFISFLIAFNLGLNILNSNLLSRTVATIVQFFLLKKVVFRVEATIVKFFIFYMYVMSMGSASALFQSFVLDTGFTNYVVAKIGVEAMLFVLNFAFVRMYVFTKRFKNEEN